MKTKNTPGHRRRRRHDSPNVENIRPRPNNTNSYGILPAPGILESYEEISQGSVKKIINMAELEQQHRHKWENHYLKVMAYNNRVGQLLAFVLAIVLIYTSIAFVMAHDIIFACVLIVVGFAFLITMVLSSCFSRRAISHPNKNYNK